MCVLVSVWVGGKAEDDEFLICDVASRFNCCWQTTDWQRNLQSFFRTPLFPFRCGRVGGEILIKEIAVNPVSRAQVEHKKKAEENYLYFSSEDDKDGVDEDGEVPAGDSLKMFCMLATTQHFLLIVKFWTQPPLIHPSSGGLLRCRTSSAQHQKPTKFQHLPDFAFICMLLMRFIAMVSTAKRWQGCRILLHICQRNLGNCISCHLNINLHQI